MPPTSTEAPGRSDRWTSPKLRPFRALAHPQFRVVWITFIVGQLGFWVAFLALQALMADLTDTDGTWLGLLFFTNFIPMLIFTPLAGVVADRYERRRVLMVGFSALGVIATGLAVLTLTDRARPANLLPFAFLIGTAFAFNSPSSHSLIATVVPSEDLPSAVSLQSVGSNMSRVIGPTIAAPILALTSEDVAFVLYAATTVLVVILLGRARITSTPHEVEQTSFMSRVKAGWEHARERPPAVAALTLLAVSSLTAGAYFSMLPLIAEDVFDKGSSGLTVLAAVSGIGSVVGAVATGFRQTSPTMASTALVVGAFGLAFIVFGLAPTWPLVLLASTVVGGLYFWGMTSINALLQSLADDAKRGRLMALFVVGWAGLVPVGALWQGAFAEAFSVRAAVVAAGAITAAYSFATLARGRVVAAPAVAD